jgi:hypothetical protein
MDGESLAELKVAFERWRSRKRHVREVAPVELLQAGTRRGWASRSGCSGSGDEDGPGPSRHR